MAVDLMNAIQNELSGGSLSALASAVGAPEDKTKTAVTAALPLLIGALSRNAAQPDGASALAGALERDHTQPLTSHASALGGLGGLLSAAMGAGQGGKALDGLGMLGHILGGSQQPAAEQIGKASGLDSGTVLKLLAALAPIVMSSLGTVKQQQGMDAGGLSDYLSGQTNQITGGDPGMLGSLLDPARDGIGADDLMRVGGMLKNSGLLGKLF